MFGLFKRGNLVTLTPQEVAAEMARGEVTLVDVREDNEWAQARVAGAFHAPLSRFDSLVDALPKDKKLVFYCAGGVRSAKAVQLAQQLGGEHDTHMGGGINAWIAGGLPVER